MIHLYRRLCNEFLYMNDILSSLKISFLKLRCTKIKKKRNQEIAMLLRLIKLHTKNKPQYIS